MDVTRHRPPSDRRIRSGAHPSFDAQAIAFPSRSRPHRRDRNTGLFIWFRSHATLAGEAPVRHGSRNSVSHAGPLRPASQVSGTPGRLQHLHAPSHHTGAPTEADGMKARINGWRTEPSSASPARDTTPPLPDDVTAIINWLGGRLFTSLFVSCPRRPRGATEQPARQGIAFPLGTL